MGAVKAEVGIVRAKIEPDGKRKITCPVCEKVVVTLIRSKNNSSALSDQFGIGKEIWEAEQDEDAGGGDYGIDWQVLFDNHINGHTSSEIVTRIHKLEDSEAGWKHSADDYNRFLLDFQQAVSQSMPVVMNKVTDVLDKMEESAMLHPVPVELRGLLSDNV